MDEKIITKLEILAESAKYDISCASSGTTRRNKNGGIGSHRLGGFVTLLPLMVDVFHYLKSC